MAKLELKLTRKELLEAITVYIVKYDMMEYLLKKVVNKLPNEKLVSIYQDITKGDDIQVEDLFVLDNDVKLMVRD